MWREMVEDKAKIVGRWMQEFDDHCGPAAKQRITDVRLVPNGNSQGIKFIGEGYEWWCDVRYAGVCSENGNLCVRGLGTKIEITD